MGGGGKGVGWGGDEGVGRGWGVEGGMRGRGGIGGGVGDGGSGCGDWLSPIAPQNMFSPIVAHPKTKCAQQRPKKHVTQA